MRSELAVLSWNENVWNARNCAARRITKGRHISLETKYGMITYQKNLEKELN